MEFVWEAVPDCECLLPTTVSLGCWRSKGSDARDEREDVGTYWSIMTANLRIVRIRDFGDEDDFHGVLASHHHEWLIYWRGIKGNGQWLIIAQNTTGTYRMKRDIMCNKPRTINYLKCQILALWHWIHTFYLWEHILIERVNDKIIPHILCICHQHCPTHDTIHWNHLASTLRLDMPPVDW